MMFQFIQAHQTEYPIRLMCRVLQVSRSGYYAWRKRKPSQREVANEKVVAEIKEVHDQSRGVYGSKRIYMALRRLGRRYNHKRVARLMRQHRIHARRKRSYKRTTQSNHSYPVAPNKLNRQFQVSAPNQVWVSDITYVATAEGWLYLAVILDLYARRIVGWSMQATLKRQLVLEALGMAIKQRRPQPGLLHHSDRGSQYASHDYRAVLVDNNIDVSMSRRGNCYDNAVAESFFGSLKTECIRGGVYSSRRQAKLALFDYMEVFYNRQRLHSTLGYVPPAEFERMNGVL